MTKLISGDIWSPICSPDGQFVFYLNVAHPEKIWRLGIAGGTPTAISDVLGEGSIDRLSVSHDGRFLLYAYALANPLALKLAVVPANGGPPVHQYEVPGGISNPRWSADGTALRYLMTRNGVSNIWEQPLTGGKPTQVTHFTSGEVFDFDWSADRKRLLLTRGNLSSDVVLIRNIR